MTSVKLINHSSSTADWNDYVETSFKNCGLVKPASLDKAVQNLFKELGEDFADDDIEITLKKNRNLRLLFPHNTSPLDI